GDRRTRSRGDGARRRDQRLVRPNVLPESEPVGTAHSGRPYEPSRPGSRRRLGDGSIRRPQICHSARGLRPVSAGPDQTTEQMAYALRTDGDPLRYVTAVRKIVHEADARVPVTNVVTQAGEIDQTINQEIVLARLCTAFAALAL